jgi:cytochrome c5
MTARTKKKLIHSGQSGYKQTLSRKVLWFFSGLILLALSTLLASFVFAGDSITNHAHTTNFYPTYPTPNYGSEAQNQLIKRGEYLVKIGDCISCHTDSPHQGKAFAGGLAINTPFGVFYSPNITADKETGIGKWTDDDFIHALHDGLNPKGKNYFPVFPYTSFTKVNKQDLLAIKAYLFSIPPIHQKNKRPGAPWPFSWRFAQLGWKLLFFDKGYYKYDGSKSPQWNRGAYLVQGLGHCGECHTPRNILGAMENKYYLTGAIIDGYWAPDITRLEFRNVPVEQLVQVFDKAQLINRAGPVRGPMAEVDHNSLMNLNQSDLDAIATYLISVKSSQPRLPKGITGRPNIAAGRKIYKSVCAICHDKGIAGAPIIYDTANWTNRLRAGIDSLYMHAINGYNNMPPKGGCVTCTDKDVIAAVDFILAKAQQPSYVSQAQGAAAPKPDTSIILGKFIYDKHCAVCHKDGLLDAPVLGNQKVWKPLLSRNLATLIVNTVKGIGSMPPRGGCKTCSNAAIIAAVKYMAQQGNPEGNYSKW